jgi:chemotaxis methyl-accepting protein methylase
VFTEKVWQVVEAFVSNDGASVRCRDVVEALGEEVVPRRVEKVRHHLKRLVAAGQLVEAGSGLFTLPGQRGAARG